MVDQLTDLLRRQGARITAGVALVALVLTAGIVAPSAAHATVSWSTALPGVTGTINAIAVDSSGRIYVGGNFSSINGVSASDIAMWDGSTWQTLGGGTTGGMSVINDIALDDTGNVYIGGYFDGAGGVSSRNVAMWNGVSWQALGTGTDVSNGIYDILWHSSYGLVIGGDFSLTQGGATYRTLARWTGSAWAQIGGVNPNGDVRSMVVMPTSGDLVVSGQFSNMPNSAIFWARWNGTSWNAFPVTPNAYGASLAADSSGNLYAAGSFNGTNPTTVAISNVAKWDGSSWTNMGANSTGIAGVPKQLHMRSNVLTAGIQGYTVNGFNYIEFGTVQRWNGSTWDTLGGNFDKGVLALASLPSGDMLAGGAFTLNGATPVTRLARWGVPVFAPGAPVLTGATPTSTTAAITYTVDDTGGATVTRMEFALDDTVTVDDSTLTINGTFTLTGLQSGRTYSIYARAVNVQGAGSWSTPMSVTTESSPSTPPPPLVIPPGPPTGVSALPGDGTAAVTWSAPVDSGSLPVYGYVVRAQPGGQTCSTASTSCMVRGLTNGTPYTFTVTAWNIERPGDPSAPSTPVTPRTVPAPPTTVAVSAGVGSATVTWSPPTDDGGSPITAYRVSASPAVTGCMTDGELECSLTGLTPGQEYAITVTAVNAAGESAPSTPTVVTPRTEPTIVISGSRMGSREGVVHVSGQVAGLDVTEVQPYYRLGSKRGFRPSATAAPVESGAFTWQLTTRKRVIVYVTAGELMSNRVVVAAR